MKKKVHYLAGILLMVGLLSACGNGVDRGNGTAGENGTDGGVSVAAESLTETDLEAQPEAQSEADSGEGQRAEDQLGTPSEAHAGEESRLEAAESTELLAESVPEAEEWYFEQDGKHYEKVRDLIDGQFHWASAVTEGKQVLDDHGHETTDYNSQQKTFESLDGAEVIEVRRWDNLLYSAGEYLIYEYDGTRHVSKTDRLYYPVLNFAGEILKTPDGYMTVENRAYQINFYDENFEEIKTVDGYRFDEDHDRNGGYPDGLAPVRDMSTGVMGYMNLSGELVLPCIYGYASRFSNGYASVLVDSTLKPYTEDGGAAAMFDAEGGQWAIIDTQGNYALAPKEAYANREADDGQDYYCGARRFSEVRQDGTVDFLDISKENQVLETIKLP